MTDSPHVNSRAEATLIATVLLSPRTLGRLVVDERVRPEHFAHPALRTVFTAMVDVHDAGQPVNGLTVTEHLRAAALLDGVGGAAFVDDLHRHADTDLRGAARIVRENAAWRQRQAALNAAAVAVDARDLEQLAAAEHELAQASIDRPGRQSGDPRELVRRLLQRLEEPDTRRYPWPWEPLNRMTRGGMRPKQITFLSGATRFGKSVICDQCLESPVAADPSVKTWLYLNEMSEEERVERTMARGTLTPMERLGRHPMAPMDRQRIDRWAAGGGPAFGMEDVAGWTAQDIARDILHRRPQVAAIDLLDELPLLPGMNRRETSEESMRIFKQTAQQADCHLIVVGHLNRNRSSGSAVIPVPTLGDIRESGMLANRSHNVLLLHREQDERTGNPLDDGTLVAAKVRGGKQGAVPLMFLGDLQRFDWMEPERPADADEEAHAAIEWAA